MNERFDVKRLMGLQHGGVVEVADAAQGGTEQDLLIARSGPVTRPPPAQAKKHFALKRGAEESNLDRGSHIPES